MLRCMSWPAAGWTSLLSCHIAVETCDTARIQPSTWRIIAPRPSPRRPSKPRWRLSGLGEISGKMAFAIRFFSLFPEQCQPDRGLFWGGLSRPDQEGMLIVCLCRAHKRHGGERLKRLIQRPRRISTDTGRPPPPHRFVGGAPFPSLGSALGVCATCNSSSPIPLVS